ncbi:hypothetical protein MYCTH_94734 [Thermothelomyces thermophilus ATCC 42464]|uniref:Uncharacterized protein n=1 Tax=Thermothelomyces thermophilus (strain ATCC 42464 / BCRC 31852 / DSM 1799) TaxID=573729 RepID=G2QFL6_THET4|nr:uncharacterized protein MYCTH_94734 [Thermothelomyces thermophilus ATCC 42464]AEO59233.1 hypothetical protein MYCTH_94734 [Thermothelomyces thermophilus ATCC 42464]
MLDQLSVLSTCERQRIAGDQGDETFLGGQDEQQSGCPEESDDVPDVPKSWILPPSADVGNKRFHDALETKPPSGGEGPTAESHPPDSLDPTATRQHGEHTPKTLPDEKPDNRREEAGFGGESQDGGLDDVDDYLDAEQQSQDHSGLRSPYGHPPSTLDKELALSGELSDDSSSYYSGATSLDVSHVPEDDLSRWTSSSEEKNSSEVPAGQSSTQPQKCLGESAGDSKRCRKPEKPSHAGSSDPVRIDGRVDGGDEEKDNEDDQALEPSAAALPYTPKETGKQGGDPGRKSGEVPSPDTGSPSRARSPAIGRPALSVSPPTATCGAEDRPPPLFLILSDEDARFAPFSGEGAPRPGESRTDVMVRDQIARCEAIRGQPLNDEEKEVIRSYYREMNQRRAPRETSEPTKVHSVAELAKLEDLAGPPGSNSEADGSSNRGIHGGSSPASDGGVPGVTNDDYDDDSNTVQPSKLLNMIRDLEARFKDAAGQLMREKQETEKRLEKLEKELQDVRAVLNEPAVGGSGSDSGAAGYTHAWGGQALQANGLSFTPTLVVAAMVALVWLVTEAMLHSKRLSDGYGPFINGGYNGLASVVVFGTWTQFILFIIVSTYLGVVSVLGTLRR